MSLIVYSQECISSIIRRETQLRFENPEPKYIEDEIIHHPLEISSFYESLGFDPAWIFPKNTNDLISAIRESGRDGLLPEDYHFSSLEKLLLIRRSPAQDAFLDILLTDAFITYALHLKNGKSDPEILFPGKWERHVEDCDINRILISALQHNTVAESLDSLRPRFGGYIELMNRLKSYETNECKVTTIPYGEDMDVGVEDDRINLVKLRLKAPGPLSSCYDSLLYWKVVEFQFNHGLKPDGIIGKRTLEALNESGEKAIGRIKANLERYRWLPPETLEVHVVVNIPDFRLRVMTGDSVILSMRAIVGRPERSTPIFNSHIRYLILNPTWTIPPTILREDVLPAVQRDAGYLVRHNLRVIDKNGMEISPDSLPWKKYSFRNFPYQLQQDPGVGNSMGLLKFQFPNQYKVYLHDTNAPNLFSQSTRALSSGCIRIERPLDLAALLLRDTKWSREKLKKEIASGKTRTIVFDKLVPIYLEYFTTFVDEHGIVQTRDDVYNIDTVVLRAIETPLNSPKR